MSSDSRIAIDAMGGDEGIAVAVPAALQALENNPDLQLYLVGDSNRIEPYLLSISAKKRSRLHLVHTEEQIQDGDSPAKVLKNGKQTSMYLAVELLKNGSVEAMVSAGNTGALLMIGRHLLKTIEGIQKPAMVATIPAASKTVYLLDVGANPNCNSRQLFQFSVMGSVLAESLSGVTAKVGLLNIGSEHYKGTDEVREAAQLLENNQTLDYVGFIEANELLNGNADVIVCDGFVGNVTIKSSAGVANLVKTLLDEQARDSWINRLLNVFSISQVTRLSEQINPHRFNGASLLGLQGSIVKSHGNATVEGFAYAIQQAVSEIENAVPQLIAEKVAAIMQAS